MILSVLKLASELHSDACHFHPHGARVQLSQSNSAVGFVLYAPSHYDELHECEVDTGLQVWTQFLIITLYHTVNFISHCWF